MRPKEIYNGGVKLLSKISYLYTRIWKCKEKHKKKILSTIIFNQVKWTVVQIHVSCEHTFFINFCFVWITYLHIMVNVILQKKILKMFLKLNKYTDTWNKILTCLIYSLKLVMLRYGIFSK